MLACVLACVCVCGVCVCACVSVGGWRVGVIYADIKCLFLFTLNNCLEQGVEQALQFYEQYFHENRRAKKHETAQYNTAKLTQPRTKAKRGSAHA